MKAILRMLSCLLCAGLLASCEQKYDETGLLGLLDTAKQQIGALQAQSDTTAAKVKQVQALVKAQQEKDLITGVEPYAPNGETIGYRILFERNEPIVIYNGDIDLFSHMTDLGDELAFHLGEGQDISIPKAHPGAILARFSVAEGRYVYFSKGNLQYHCKNRVWRFAEPQWATIGNIYTQVDADYDGWISHFGWATSGYRNTADGKNIHYMPYDLVFENNSTTYPSTGYGPQTAHDNGGLYVENREYDWGVHNAIANGGDRAGEWRCLTMYEWQYVIKSRAHYSDLRSICTVDGVLGMVLMPDDYDFITPRGEYTAEEFRRYELYGAVFLPAEGYRYGTQMVDYGTHGFYWSSSEYLANSASCANFRKDSYGGVYTPSQQWTKPYGLTVRLVKDIPAQ